MSPSSAGLRIALLHHAYRGAAGDAGTHQARELALALAAAGHEVELIAAGPPGGRAVEDGVTVLRGRTLPDAPLRLRKIGDRPGRLPGSWLSLRAGAYCLAHAFTPQDALAALLWSRSARRPVVFTCSEPLRRDTIADRRLRLALLRCAVERTDAVIAPDRETAQSLRRWLAVEARLVAPGSAEGHLALYAELARGAQGPR